MNFCVLFLLLFAISTPEIYFKEGFNGNWKERWVVSESKPEKDRGQFTVAAPKRATNKERAKGLKTLNDSKYYQISADIGKTVSNENKTLIFSYTVIIEGDHKCGGTYIKLLPDGIDQKNFSGEPYYVMFGPDWCGAHTEKAKFVVYSNAKNESYESKNPPQLAMDKKTHLWTLIIKPDFSYDLQIDSISHRKGKLYEDFDCFLNPTIDDPEVKKPDKWEDEPEIPNPKFPKPDDWDQPMTIIDPKAKKPKNWNEEENGPWEAPEIVNPDYKGTWYPKLMPNPNYIGQWRPPQIPNPEFVKNKNDYWFSKIRYVGIDVWQPSAGSIFDNIFLGDDMNEFRKFVKFGWEQMSQFEASKEEEDKRKKAKYSQDDEGGNNAIAVNKGGGDEDDDPDDDDNFPDDL